MTDNGSPILVTYRYHHSGKTWVGRMLALDPLLAYVDEISNPNPKHPLEKTKSSTNGKLTSRKRMKLNTIRILHVSCVSTTVDTRPYMDFPVDDLVADSYYSYATSFIITPITSFHYPSHCKKIPLPCFRQNGWRKSFNY